MFPVFSDLSRTARALGRDRSFALTALATFALCVAANVAIFAVVRAVLLPAVMTVLGERNWYLPRRLGWLPRLRLDEAPSPVLD